MKIATRILIGTLGMFALSTTATAAEMQTSALTCADFEPTQEALDRFPDLMGACEAVVESNGELYGQFRAIVRRAGGSSVTLYLPATDHTFTIRPSSEARVLVGGRKIRPRELSRGDEISIYLAASTFGKPAVDEVVMVTETEAVIEVPATVEAALPTTASPWPGLAAASLLLLGCGAALRRRRVALADPR